jgi:hypothetical protein
MYDIFIEICYDKTSFIKLSNSLSWTISHCERPPLYQTKHAIMWIFKVLAH